MRFPLRFIVIISYLNLYFVYVLSKVVLFMSFAIKSEALKHFEKQKHENMRKTI